MNGLDYLIQDRLEFTPLEFETVYHADGSTVDYVLEFTPLEFETQRSAFMQGLITLIRIYSVGV